MTLSRVRFTHCFCHADLHVCVCMHTHAHAHLEKQATSLRPRRTPSAKHSFDLLSDHCIHTCEMLGAGLRGSEGSGVRAGLQLGIRKILFLPFSKHKGRLYF